MDIPSSPSPPNRENLSLCIYYSSLELFIQINLRAEAKPGGNSMGNEEIFGA